MPPPSRETWGQLKLPSVPQKVRNLLHITKLHLMFESFDDEAATIPGFQSEAP